MAVAKPKSEFKVEALLRKKTMMLDMHPSLASLGDGLPSSAGSQRDEAKRHAPALQLTRTQDLCLRQVNVKAELLMLTN